MQTVDRSFLRGRGTSLLDAHLGKLLLLTLLCVCVAWLLVRTSLAGLGKALLVLSLLWAFANAMLLAIAVPEFARNEANRSSRLVRFKKLALVFAITLIFVFPLLCTTASFVGLHPFTTDRGARQGVSNFVKTPNFSGGGGVMAPDDDPMHPNTNLVFVDDHDPANANAAAAAAGAGAAEEDDESAQHAALQLDRQPLVAGVKGSAKHANNMPLLQRVKQAAAASVRGGTPADEPMQVEESSEAHVAVALLKGGADRSASHGGVHQLPETDTPPQDAAAGVLDDSQHEGRISDENSPIVGIADADRDHRAAHPGVKTPAHSARDHLAPDGGFQAATVSHDHSSLDGAVQGGSLPEGGINHDDHSGAAQIEGGAEDHRAAHAGPTPAHTAADHEAPVGGFRAGTVTHEHAALDGAVQGGSLPEGGISHEDRSADAAIEGGADDHRAAHTGKTPPHTAADHEAPDGGFAAAFINHEHEPLDGSVQGGSLPEGGISHEDRSAAAQIEGGAEDHRAAHTEKTPPHTPADHEAPEGGFRAGTISHEHGPLDAAVQGGSQPEGSINHDDHSGAAQIEGGARDHRAAHPGVKMPPHTANDHLAPEGGFQAATVSHDHDAHGVPSAPEAVSDGPSADMTQPVPEAQAGPAVSNGASKAALTIAGDSEGTVPSADEHTPSRDDPSKAAPRTTAEEPARVTALTMDSPATDAAVPATSTPTAPSGPHKMNLRERVGSEVASAAAGEGALGKAIHAAATLSKVGAASPSGLVASALTEGVARTTAARSTNKLTDGLKPKIARAAGHMVDAMRQRAAKLGIKGPAGAAEVEEAAAIPVAAPVNPAAAAAASAMPGVRRTARSLRKRVSQPGQV